MIFTGHETVFSIILSKIRHYVTVNPSAHLSRFAYNIEALVIFLTNKLKPVALTNKCTVFGAQNTSRMAVYDSGSVVAS